MGMAAYKQIQTMLPKFLIADNSQEANGKIFVLHTQSPRCLVETDVENESAEPKIHWFDKAIKGDALENLLEKADDFLEKELDSQENLYDKEFGA